MFDLYKTYNKAKDVFAKPKLKVSFGLWRNSPGLPVWRSGPNIHIGKHCVIGANSVVTKNIPDYCVAAGVPARIIKKYNFTTETWEKIL